MFPIPSAQKSAINSPALLAVLLGVATQFTWGQTPQPAQPNLVFKADDNWRVVDVSSVEVKAGSALDLSPLTVISKKPTDKGSLPRLVIGATGRIEAQDEPDRPLRLKGTNVNMPWIVGKAFKDPNWKEIWDNEALQAQRQGYNLMRTCFDGIQKEDLQITPELLDKADYFISTMGEKRIYFSLIIGSNGVFLKNAWGPLLPGQRRDYTVRMYMGDAEVRNAWKFGAETLMNHVNAYTGLAWKDDPRIAYVELYNEQEWGFFSPLTRWSPQTRQEFDAKFRQWLEAKYKTPEALAKAWGEPALSDFAQANVPERFPTESRKARDNDYVLFCTDLSHESARWMRETLRATGYAGMVAQYNISQWLAGQEARWGESQVTIANTYFNHPTAFEKPGSKCGADSSIQSEGWYWRGIAATRFADRPFVETEYNHPFWNSYQHEGGLLFGAYSSLQGLDSLIVHSDAVFSYVGKPGIGLFSVSNSPVLRANQFLLSCLWQRGDVKQSPHRIELQIPKKYIETDGNGGRTVSAGQGKLAFLTGFSVAFPWSKPADGVGKPATPADWALAPSDSAEFQSMGGGWAIGGNGGAEETKFSLDAAVKRMKKMGILPAENVSYPAEGILQSDTGEITMRTRENLLKVATPRSEAVTMEAGTGEQVGQLEVLGTSVPALVGACTVDGKKLANSKRVVLIYATDTANTGMELSADRTTLVRLGEPPILMQAGKLEAKLKNANGTKMSLYALGLDGSRREKLPLKVQKQTLSISFDTGTLKDGPTPFFELVAE